MARESVQRKLDRVRPPRVQISYDEEVGGAIEARELPFVIGVLSDFTGQPSQPRRLSDRKFIEIDLDSFNNVLAEMSPRARFRISSSLGGGEMDVDLTFRSIEDFDPDNVINQLEPLANLRDSLTPESCETLRRHLDRVLHAPEFQLIEAAWRSLWYLVLQTETGAGLRIKILDVTKRELLKDFQRSTEFDKTHLFKVVYEEPYGAFGADPFGLLLGNFAFGPSGEEVELLEGLGQTASMCNAPFIAGVAPAMFGIAGFHQIPAMRDLSREFDSSVHARWKSFRESQSARYVGLALPRLLLRSPYGIRPSLPGEIQYQEDIGGGQHLLWGNAAFAFGVCVANAFSRFGWCGAIRGIEGGGLVEGLPTWISRTEEEPEVRASVEFQITDRREKELSDLGFLALTQVKNSNLAVFYNSPSCYEPGRYDSEAANLNSRLSCQLQYVLTGSRFMHYFKVMVRDARASYSSRGDWERLFNRWISHYVNVDDMASPSIRVRAPLREARIEVAEDRGRPGTYMIIGYIRPHFQMDELSVSLRFIGSIP
jgi:type VI secretion system protein ImpC